MDYHLRYDAVPVQRHGVRRELAAERRWERRQEAAHAQTYGSDVALAAEEAHEAPDTGGASSSQGPSAALLPSLQAQRSWEHAKWVGHTS